MNLRTVSCADEAMTLAAMAGAEGVAERRRSVLTGEDLEGRIAALIGRYRTHEEIARLVGCSLDLVKKVARPHSA